MLPGDLRPEALADFILYCAIAKEKCCPDSDSGFVVLVSLPLSCHITSCWQVKSLAASPSPQASRGVLSIDPAPPGYPGHTRAVHHLPQSAAWLEHISSFLLRRGCYIAASSDFHGSSWPRPTKIGEGLMLTKIALMYSEKAHQSTHYCPSRLVNMRVTTCGFNANRRVCHRSSHRAALGNACASQAHPVKCPPSTSSISGSA